MIRDDYSCGAPQGRQKSHGTCGSDCVLLSSFPPNSVAALGVLTVRGLILIRVGQNPNSTKAPRHLPFFAGNLAQNGDPENRKAQPSRQFGPLCSLCLGKEVFYRQRACAEILPRRPLIEILYRDLAKRDLL